MGDAVAHAEPDRLSILREMKHTVTIFKNITATATGFHRGVEFVFDRIRRGNSLDLLNQIRFEPEKGKRNELKKGLPSICFSGTFKNRSVNGLIAHSGLICLDFDGFPDADTAKTWRDTLMGWEHTFALFTSPSGDGLKLIVKIPPEPENHKAYFDAIKDHFACEYFDESTSDVSRVCYESYDADLYYNPESAPWTDRAEPDEEGLGDDEVEIRVVSESRIISNLDKWFQNKYGKGGKGNRNNNLYRFANALNSFGVPEVEAERHLLQFAEPGGKEPFTQTEIKALVKSAYKKRDRHATRFFEDHIAKSTIEKMVRAGKKEDEIAVAVPHIKDNIEAAIASVKDTMSVTDFWTYNEKGKVQLSPHRYKYFLEQSQFFKFFPDGANGYVFVQIDSNLLADTSAPKIKDYVLGYLQSRTDIGYSPFDFMANQTRLFKDDYLSMLDTARVTLKSDTEDKCYLYFRNCAVEITRDDVKQVDYIDLDGYVWKRHVNDRDFQGIVEDGDFGMFHRFVDLIAGRDQRRFNSLMSVAGYLLHSYKTSANNKAIIFNDEAISENPNGGSGKGLFNRAIGYMKRTCTLDGKQFSFEKSFPYQTVSADTQVLVFDDVRKNFPFEQLFSLITEGITLEKKNKDAIYIPVAKSPKIVINTNYTIGGVGGSFDRRKFEVELSSYFGAHRTPFDEFGKMLFDDWDSEEWRRFDSFMIAAVQFYLTNGLVAHQFNNLDVRKFIKETSNEFNEWANDENLPKGMRIDKAEAYDHFVSEYPDFSKLSRKRFAQWIEAYGNKLGERVTSGKSMNTRWIQIGEDRNQMEF